MLRVLLILLFTVQIPGLNSTHYPTVLQLQGIFFFWLVDSLIESIIYSFYKYLWSTYYMPCTLVATGHTAVSQETAALMNLPF